MANINTPNNWVDNKKPVSKESIQVVKDPLLWVLDDWDKSDIDGRKINLDNETLNNFKIAVADVLTEPWNFIFWHWYSCNNYSWNNEDTVKSILENWLRMKGGTLYYTTIWLENEFSSLNLQDQNNIINMLLEWPYNKLYSVDHTSTVDYIPIISYPKKFYGQGLDKSCSENSISYINTENNNKYTRPEFVKWYFDVRNWKFVKNDKYYKNLSHDKQEHLFLECKYNFIKGVIDNWVDLETYIQLKDDCPYTMEDVQKYKEIYWEPQKTSDHLEESIQKYKEVYWSEDQQETSGLRCGSNNQNNGNIQTNNESNEEEGNRDRDR